MDEPTEFRCGCLRFSEWKGFWKAHANDSGVTGQEWDNAWESLNEWLSVRYLVRFSNDFPPTKWMRHCWVEGDFLKPERTMTVIIGVAEVLSLGFLKFVQEWLQREARAWRVAVPIDNTDENLVLVYPEEIRINAAAERDLLAFIQRIRPLLHRTIYEGQFGRNFFGLKDKPYPPVPAD